MRNQYAFFLFFGIFFQNVLSALYVPPPLNFTAFHTAIHKAFDSSQQIVLPLSENVSIRTNTTECYMPKKGIMFSFANSHMMELVELQHNTMDIWNMRKCLESRFITVCLDRNCFQRCTQNKINNCVDISYNNSMEIPASNFAQGVSLMYTMLIAVCYEQRTP